MQEASDAAAHIGLGAVFTLFVITLGPIKVTPSPARPKSNVTPSGHANVSYDRGTRHSPVPPGVPAPAEIYSSPWSERPSSASP